MSNQELKSSVKELILSAIIPAVFLIIGIIAYMFFKENSYPVNYEYVNSAAWARYFIFTFITGVVVCVVFNIFIAVLAIYVKIRSSAAWWLYLVLSVLISLCYPLYIYILYPEESSCYVIAFLLFVLMYLVTFVVSTANCSKAWRSFFPFSSNKMKKR